MSDEVHPAIARPCPWCGAQSGTPCANTVDKSERPWRTCPGVSHPTEIAIVRNMVEQHFGWDRAGVDK
jgi:hypothetical protein